MIVKFHFDHASPLEDAEGSDQNLETAIDDFYQDILEDVRGTVPKIEVVKRFDEGSADCQFSIDESQWDWVWRKMNNHMTVEGEGKYICLEFYGGYVACDFDW